MALVLANVPQYTVEEVSTEVYTESAKDAMEHLPWFKNYHWTMFDGEKFHKEVYDKYHEKVSKEELDDVIAYGHATLVWRDAVSEHVCSLKAPEITLSYVMNSILYRYKRTHTRPGKVCMLDDVYYNPFTQTIRIVFGN